MNEYEKKIAELEAENLELRKNYFCLLEIAKQKVKGLEGQIKSMNT